MAAGRIDFSIDPDTGTWRATPARAGGRRCSPRPPSSTPSTCWPDARPGRRARRRRRAVRDRDHRRPARRRAPRRDRHRGRRRAGGGDPARARGREGPATPTREQVQQEADRATFERRAVAVERERAIGENELQTQIELARREEQLVAQRGANARREAEENAAGRRDRGRGGGARAPDAGRGRRRGRRGWPARPQAEAEAARVAAYAEASRGGAAGAGRQGAGRQPAPDRQSLVLTPDLLTRALAQLGTAGRRAPMSLTPRVVVVHRRTEYDELLARHGTHGQAAFFLSHPGPRHRRARGPARRPAPGPRGRQRRRSRSTGGAAASSAPTSARFLFAPDDVVVVVGQDGLVANVAKYLDGQPVIGIDPEPGRNAGRAGAPTRPATCRRRCSRSHADRRRRSAPWSRAELDDGQRLLALNEIFVGPSQPPDGALRAEPPAGGARARRPRRG